MRCCCGQACVGPEGGRGQHVRLIVWRLERLSRNVHVITGLMMLARCRT
jgi:hypothetical protein